MVMQYACTSIQTHTSIDTHMHMHVYTYICICIHTFTQKFIHKQTIIEYSLEGCFPFRMFCLYLFWLVLTWSLSSFTTFYLLLILIFLENHLPYFTSSCMYLCWWDIFLSSTNSWVLYLSPLANLSISIRRLKFTFTFRVIFIVWLLDDCFSESQH